eukprot:4200221-Karenia_brevis.AAC.1
MVAYGDGRQVVHIMSIYGYTGSEQNADRMRKNEALLADAFTAAAELGNVPIMILGDFNVIPERSAVIRTACATGC